MGSLLCLCSFYFSFLPSSASLLHVPFLQHRHPLLSPRLTYNNNKRKIYIISCTIFHTKLFSFAYLIFFVRILNNNKWKKLLRSCWASFFFFAVCVMCNSLHNGHSFSLSPHFTSTNVNSFCRQTNRRIRIVCRQATAAA